MAPSRRDVLKGLGAIAGATAAGCGSGAHRSGAGNGGPFVAGPNGFPTDVPPTPAPSPTPLSPEALLAPIDTVVVLMMENRSFDHFFGARKLVEGLPVEGLTGSESNPAPDGSTVGIFNLEDYTPADPPHGWDASHAQWDSGANDGFVIQHAGDSQAEVMGYHVRSQLPTIYELADQFVTCDHWHASVMGPTWPNRYFLHGASSNGAKTNVPVSGFKSVFDMFDYKGIAARTYFHDLPFQTVYGRFTGLAGIEQFFSDAAAGTLPPFSILDPKFSGADANDDHPDHDIHLGQALLASIYGALAASPQWGRCLFVLTYDEHGGFFDHVAPPTTVDARPDFEQIGFRVPAVVAGPFVRAGAVVSDVFEHASVISTLTKRFELPSLNARVDATNDLSRCIDPSLVSAAAPRRAPRLQPVAISTSALRDRLARGPRRIDHAEMQALADDGAMREFDRRGNGAEITRRVLEAGAKLGAVRLVD